MPLPIVSEFQPRKQRAGSTTYFFDSNPLKTKQQRLKQNRHIKKKGSVLHVVKIIIHVFMNGLFPIPAQLPQAGDARQGFQSFGPDSITR